MSKIKMSFSLIMALLLVGILSSVAFAATYTSYGLSVATNAAKTGFTVTVNRITGTNDTVVLQQFTTSNPNGAFGNEVDTNLTSWNNDQATVNVNNATLGTVYKFVVADSSGNNLVNGKPVYAVIYNTLGQKMATITTNPSKIDATGTGLNNSNKTLAKGAPKKSDTRTSGSQKLHGFYQNNTNSCASCHETHTAANGESLLFKDGTYSTCSSCHDGTTGAFNAFTDNGDPNGVAGTFNVDTSSAHNGSLHQADGSLQVSAAPGGNHNAAADTVATATYGGEFDCASCHNPHGGGSNNENNLNEDPLGWGGIAYATTNSDTQNGKLFPNVQITDLTKGGTLPTAMNTPYILVKRTLTASDKVSTINNATAGYLYGRGGAHTGDTILQAYRWSGGIVLNTDGSIKSGGYVADFSLFLRSTGHVNAPFTNANTVFYNTAYTGTTAPTDPTANITNQLNVVWRDAFVYAPTNADGTSALDAVKSAQISLGIDVETPKTTVDPNTGKDTGEVAVLVDSTNGNYVYDAGTEMSKYCSACHVDYLSTTRTNVTGDYTLAHRHATAQDRLSCVRCHFAHGTDATIMKDANDQTYTSLQTNYGFSANEALNYLVDPNASSALKRYTGMSVCYACHGKGESFMSNPNVNTDKNTGAVSGPYLLNGDPGAARTARADVPVISSFAGITGK